MNDDIKTLTIWDFLDTKEVPDGYYTTRKVVASDRNFELLLEHHNKLIEKYLKLEEEMYTVEERLNYLMERVG